MRQLQPTLSYQGTTTVFAGEGEGDGEGEMSPIPEQTIYKQSISLPASGYEDPIVSSQWQSAPISSLYWFAGATSGYP